MKFHLGIVKDPLPGHESYKGRLAIPYITPSGVVDIRFRSINNHPDEPKYMGVPGAKTTMYNAQADGDNAGLEFGKKLSRELGNVNLLQMPEGHDVNSIIVQEGKEWIDERIRKCLG